MIVKCLIIISLATYAATKKEFVMKLEKFDNCPDYTNYTGEVKNASIRLANNLIYLNYDMHFKKDTRGPLDLTVEIKRCNSKADTNCFVINKMRSTKFCSFIAAEGKPWSQFLSCLKPKLACPLKKAVYKAHECAINPGVFNMMPIPNAFWMFRATISEKRVMLMCIDIGGYAVN